MKAAVLSDALTLVGFRAEGEEGCSKETCCCRVQGWSCCDERALDGRKGGFEFLSCDV